MYVCMYVSFTMYVYLYVLWYQKAHIVRPGVQPAFRQPRIHTRQYLDKYCMNQ